MQLNVLLWIDLMKAEFLRQYVYLLDYMSCNPEVIQERRE
jgi:hypothetical protein